MRSPMDDDGLLRRLGEKPSWEAFGPTWMRWTLCVCAQCQWSGICQRSMGPHSVLLFFLIQKKPAIVPNSEAFNSLFGDGFQVPGLKGDSEASKDEQANSSSENNVGNGALFVIKLHGSGDVIAHFLRDWEVAKGSLELPYSIRYALPRVA